MTLHQLLKSLDYERLAGTSGEERGRNFIIGHLQEQGLNPKAEAFEIKGFESGTAIVSVKDQSWEATPYGLCGDFDIEGELVYLENADALLYNPGAYDDKIVLFYHSSKRLYDLAEQSRVHAFIGISAPFKKAYSYSHRQNRNAQEIFPAVMIRYDYAEKLTKYAGQTIKISAQQKAETKTAHNIVLDIAGSNPDGNLTMLVGHYDTVARSHGSCDNAAGSVAMIKVAEYFVKKQPQRDLRIIWFSAEELGLLGSFAYVKAHEEEIAKRVKLVINVDLAGDPIGRNVMMVLGSKELMGYASGILKEEGLLFSESLSIYSSDCMPFSVLEIPSLNLARVGGKALYFGHTEDDIAKHTNEYGLKDVYQASLTLLKRILNSVFYPVNKEIDPSLRDDIERYLWHSRLEKPELKWKEKYRK